MFGCGSTGPRRGPVMDGLEDKQVSQSEWPTMAVSPVIDGF